MLHLPAPHRTHAIGWLTRLAYLFPLFLAPLTGCGADEPKYLDHPEPIAAEGSWSQEPSGMVFPAVVAGFQRVGIARFSEQQSDAAVGYNLLGDSGPVAATIYLRPAPSLPTVGLSAEAVAAMRSRSCRVEFEARKRDIAEGHAARLLEERAISLRKNGRVRPGRLSVFAYQANFAGRQQPVRSELASFCFGGDQWSMEFRFTYPDRIDAEDRIAGFMQALSWTGHLAP